MIDEKSLSQAEPSDLTRGEWVAPTPEARTVTPERRIDTACRFELDSETRDLLHGRLRAASLVMAAAFGLFLVHDLLFLGTVQGVIYMHALLFLLLVVNFRALSGRWKPSMKQLRILELGTFATILACFIASQALSFRIEAARGAAREAVYLLELRTLFKNSIIGTLLLILTYGIFIPNHWKRAAWLIVLMAIAPLVAPVLLGLTSHEFRLVAQATWTPQRLLENGLFLAVGAAVAIYGTYTINASRTEEFHARWLNRYRLIRKLGAGGMGEVYLAEHELLKRPCAIKLIRPNLSAKPRVLARFEREARATARLSHWNTVDLFDYGCTADGTFYYVMEYLPGLSLQALVEKHGPLPPGRAIYLLRQACEALREAHDAGFIHRDLKPPNIFSAYRGGRFDVAKVLDFGLVKATRDDDSPPLTREGMVTGSPLYMAPEQVTRSHPPDPRTDLYAVGAIGYFLLTRQPPFQGTDPVAVMAAQARDPVVPPTQLDPAIPSDLEAVILRCLEKDPDRRYQDAGSLSDAFSNCAAAAEWSARQAQTWWQTHEPDLARQCIASEPTEADESAEGSGPASECDVTLGAGDVELVESLDDGTDRLSLTIGENAKGPDPRR